MNRDLAWFFNRRELGVNLGLNRIRALLNKLDNPQNKLKIIHIAGTNGKGSTANFITNGLIEAGYKTGLFSSPSLDNYIDQIKINQQSISKEDFISLIKKIRPIVEELDQKPETCGLTEYEILTVIMWLYFDQENVDYAVVETCLGGLTDATNVCQPILTCITKIDYDHTGILGDSIEDITRHKAGIIKYNTPLVITNLNPISQEIIKETAQNKSAPIIYAENYNFPTGMKGLHQIENGNLATEVLKQLNIDDKNIQNGLLKTHLPARLEYLSTNPPLLIDGAHNPVAMHALIDYLKETDYSKIKVLFTALKTKDIDSMLENLLQSELNIDLTFTNFDHERALSDDTAKSYSQKYKAHWEPNWQIALDKLLNTQKEGELVLATGSLYFLSLLRKYYLKKNR